MAEIKELNSSSPVFIPDVSNLFWVKIHAAGLLDFHGILKRSDPRNIII
jgi:hypothetical protein